eukprot:TRINITY_DN16965_c0_g1_i1.p1 TRINITY_DN16965_c0_g1~~TRINITY_DN16965_c0_g1_i1.p1  ORF type:complete len:211 (+),score=26.84 TRINITY_DN16965_c0_g1_i1:61-633(+)
MCIRDRFYRTSKGFVSFDAETFSVFEEYRLSVDFRATLEHSVNIHQLLPEAHVQWLLNEVDLNAITSKRVGLSYAAMLVSKSKDKLMFITFKHAGTAASFYCESLLTNLTAEMKQARLVPVLLDPQTSLSQPSFVIVTQCENVWRIFELHTGKMISIDPRREYIHADYSRLFDFRDVNKKFATKYRLSLE